MFYCLDDNNNKIEALDKEGVLAALNQAIADGSLENLVADAAFVSKLKCCVSGKTNKVGFITEAQLNELIATGTVEENTLYFITDDTTLGGIGEVLNQIINGDIPLGNAAKVNGLDIRRNAQGVLLADEEIVTRRKLLFSFVSNNPIHELSGTANLNIVNKHLEIVVTSNEDAYFDSRGENRQYFKASLCEADNAVRFDFFDRFSISQQTSSGTTYTPQYWQIELLQTTESNSCSVTVRNKYYSSNELRSNMSVNIKQIDVYEILH